MDFLFHTEFFKEYFLIQTEINKQKLLNIEMIK